jgi:BolA protein
MSVSLKIEEKLARAFAPVHLAVENESAKHAGHAAMLAEGKAGAAGESHFRVVIVSGEFRGKSRLDRHRLVNAVLADELRGPVHALAIRALTPEEAPV